MIDRELALTPAEKDIQAGSNLKTVAQLNGFPIFPAGTNSLLSKYLTREIWDNLKDEVDEHGFSFKEAIFSGC